MRGMLPEDWQDAALVGRTDLGEGPTPVTILGGQVYDVSRTAPTVSHLLKHWRGRAPEGKSLGDIGDLELKPAWCESPGRARLLAPVDLQCVKAAGVTFAVSAMERMIEERAGGVSGRAQAIREQLGARIGAADIMKVVPGSPEAAKLKEALQADGCWSQYLEVAVGPDAEIFTKAPPLSSVGWGDYVGIRTQSAWNNPEPEVVLVVDASGRAVGATLGNDVNLRDYEGRSALLLGQAKDNNASCAIGPLIRLFDDKFTIDDVRGVVLELEIEGADDYRLEGKSRMAEISRDPLELVRQALSEHQYPDGFVLFCGTLFAPTQDRDLSGYGFTHKEGDLVRIRAPQLGTLENRVTSCKAAPPWTFGIGDLMANLSKRGLL